eukprot:GHVN01027922.1.p1 GENE.GHVN01027922.1~~GHVN01027922.1.p1  ORF type:complete len:427 (+),score=126.92 GHVN01027922.1:390-1670(+)
MSHLALRAILLSLTLLTSLPPIIVSQSPHSPHQSPHLPHQSPHLPQQSPHSLYTTDEIEELLQSLGVIDKVIEVNENTGEVREVIEILKKDVEVSLVRKKDVSEVDDMKEKSWVGEVTEVSEVSEVRQFTGGGESCERRGYEVIRLNQYSNSPVSGCSNTFAPYSSIPGSHNTTSYDTSNFFINEVIVMEPTNCVLHTCGIEIAGNIPFDFTGSRPLQLSLVYYISHTDQGGIEVKAPIDFELEAVWDPLDSGKQIYFHVLNNFGIGSDQRFAVSIAPSWVDPSIKFYDFISFAGDYYVVNDMGVAYYADRIDTSGIATVPFSWGRTSGPGWNRGDFSAGVQLDYNGTPRRVNYGQLFYQPTTTTTVTTTETTTATNTTHTTHVTETTEESTEDTTTVNVSPGHSANSKGFEVVGWVAVMWLVLSW